MIDFETRGDQNSLLRPQGRGFAALHRDVWRIVRMSPMIFLGVPVAVFFLPDLVIETVIGGMDLDPMEEMRLYWKVATWESFIFGSLITAVQLAALGQLREGERMSLAHATKQGFGNWGRMIGVAWSVGWRVSLATLLLIVPGIFLAVRYSLAMPAAFLERKRGAAAIERSDAIVKGRSWKVFFLITGAVLLYLPFLLSAGMLIPGAAGPVLETVAMIPANVLPSLLVVGVTLLYVDHNKEDLAEQESPEPSSFAPVPVAASATGQLGVLVVAAVSYGSIFASWFLFLGLAVVPINAGDAAYERGDLDTALQEYTKALYWDPEDPYVHYSLAFVYSGLGRGDEAVASIRRSLELEPTDPNANHAMVEVLAGAGRAREARAHLRIAYEAGYLTHEDRGELEAWIDLNRSVDQDE